MRIIGSTDKCSGLANLRVVDVSILECPTELPSLPEGHVLIAIYKRHPNAILPGERETHELAAVCETFEDLRSLWEDHHAGYVLSLWFGSTSDTVELIP